jgi:hypothetical protein
VAPPMTAAEFGGLTSDFSAVGAGAGTDAAASTGLLASAAPFLAPVGGGLAGGSIGHYLADKFSPIGGSREKAIGGGMLGGAATGAAIGSVVPVVGTAVGAVVGGIVGGITGLVEDSVICGELVRQNEISERVRTACVVYRFRHIDDDMFNAYLEWAGPIVKQMRKGGFVNKLILPVARAFVGYMWKIQSGKVPTLGQRLVWKYAWWRCAKIAQRNEQFVGEVA